MGGYVKMRVCNKILYGFLKTFLAFPPGSIVLNTLSKRFIAGKTIEDAMSVCDKLSQRDFKIMLSFLGGEHLRDRVAVENVFHAHRRLLDSIVTKKYNCELAVKLSQWGIFSADHLHFRYIFENFLLRAMQQGVFVWIDAEELEVREQTRLFVCGLSRAYSNLGLAVQAYAKDSVSFFESIMQTKMRFPIRICKGAYSENKDKIVGETNFVRSQFLKIFLLCCRSSVPRIQIATHDSFLINAVNSFGERTFWDFDERIEFAALLGLQEEVHSNIYVAFGPKRKDYLLRRIAENPRCLFLPLR